MKALKRGNVVRCSFWKDGIAVRVTGVGDRLFLGYEIVDGEEAGYEREWSVDPDPNKMMRKESRKWVLRMPAQTS